MTTEDEIRQQVREMLGRVLSGLEPDFPDDADIFAMGLDSVSTVLLLSELESQYDISLVDDDIPYDQFRTIAGIAAFVAARRPQQPTVG